jgi:very-short-patch-repair endonuclease
MKHKLTSTARALRKKPTDAERLMWRVLRNERFSGLKFRRQEPIGKYIVDFVCTEKNVVIELDGGQHGTPEQEKYDKQRTIYLQEQGYRVIRYSNRDVLNKTQIVLQNIYDACF